MSSIEQYRANEREIARTQDLLRLLPAGRRSVLDVGARDGHFSRLLTEHFDEVTALDLVQPSFQIPRVTPVQGDATRLQFADDSFDCVFCAEVLEHIPDVQAACRELVRVAKHEIIIGVPFQQDTRVGRTTCPACGKANPPWGHVNSFTEQRLLELFAGVQVAAKSFVGQSQEATSALATFLMDAGKNPWGPYDQDEPCIHCGAQLTAPRSRSVLQRACSAAALRLNRIQRRFTKPHGNWIHLVFRKSSNA